MSLKVRYAKKKKKNMPVKSKENGKKIFDK